MKCAPPARQVVLVTVQIYRLSRQLRPEFAPGESTPFTDLSPPFHAFYRPPAVIHRLSPTFRLSFNAFHRPPPVVQRLSLPRARPATLGPTGSAESTNAFLQLYAATGLCVGACNFLQQGDSFGRHTGGTFRL